MLPMTPSPLSFSELSRGLRQADAEAAAEPGESTRKTVPQQFVTSPALGPALPGYEVLGELGRGGMGVVYKARDLALGRLVAVKVILTGRHASVEARARLRAEAEAAARVPHPHVVAVFSSGEHDGCPYFVGEYVAGGSLARRTAGRPQPPRDVARLVELLARAVHAAHDKGIVHRDLKLANILLAPPADEPALNSAYGLPKVADFGLARYLDKAEGHTVSHAHLGTPEYMAPEQAAGRARSAGPAADVYALGAILYELLTGEPPFRGETALDTLEQVRTRPVPSPRRRRPDVPAELEAICLRCLAKAPAARYPTALALAEDLHCFLEGKAAPSPASPPRGWRLRAAALSVLVLSALLVVVALSAWRSRQTAGSSTQREPPLPLRGWVDVRVWKKGAEKQPGRRLHQAGVLPLKAGDCLRIEAELDRPAYLYVIQVLASGQAVPQYPWRGYVWHSRPAEERPRKHWSLPSAPGTGAPLDPGPSGLEAIVLLAREEKLPAGADLALDRLFAELPRPKRLADPRLAAWFENGELVTTEPGRSIIRFDKEREVADLVSRARLLGARLRQQFSYTRVVYYGFQGE
jgi:serine/threonine protein kinase